jgi:hypothetical protein
MSVASPSSKLNIINMSSLLVDPPSAQLMLVTPCHVHVRAGWHVMKRTARVTLTSFARRGVR